MGIRSHEQADERPLRKISETLKRLPDGRLQVTIPWRGNEKGLKSIRSEALSHLVPLLQRLKRAPKWELSYYNQMPEKLKNGLISDVTDEKVNGPMEFYLAHHPVIRTEKITSKFDGSATDR